MTPTDKPLSFTDALEEMRDAAWDAGYFHDDTSRPIELGGCRKESLTANERYDNALEAVTAAHISAIQEAVEKEREENPPITPTERAIVNRAYQWSVKRNKATLQSLLEAVQADYLVTTRISERIPSTPPKEEPTQ